MSAGSGNERHRSYRLLDIRAHDTPNDLWMVIHNKVYNVSSFVLEHPGGKEVLFDCGGVDATEGFDDVGHSERAVTMLEPYYIGEVAPEDQKRGTCLSTSTRSKEPLEGTEKTVRWQIRKNFHNFVRPNLALLMFATLAISSLVLYLGLQRAKVPR